MGLPVLAGETLYGNVSAEQTSKLMFVDTKFIAKKQHIKIEQRKICNLLLQKLKCDYLLRKLKVCFLCFSMNTKRPESYCLIDDKKRSILVTFYESGMTSTIEEEKVKLASEETGLSVEKIKVHSDIAVSLDHTFLLQVMKFYLRHLFPKKWIGNENAKQKRKRNINIDKEPVVNRRKGERKLIAQNVFYSHLAKDGKYFKSYIFFMLMFQLTVVVI